MIRDGPHWRGTARHSKRRMDDEEPWDDGEEDAPVVKPRKARRTSKTKSDPVTGTRRSSAHPV